METQHGMSWIDDSPHTWCRRE